MKRGSQPRRLARPVAVTVGVSLKNPTFLIPLDSTNSESSETVSPTKSSTISSSIPLMTISTTHAKDKDVGPTLAQNAKSTQVLDLRANDAGETRTMLLTDLPPGPSYPFSSMGPASRRPDVLFEARLSSSAELAASVAMRDVPSAASEQAPSRSTKTKE
ncbi:hypothetical protein EDB86DRAFT_3079609 [Lactarius hatsudake]|nr:hypothetical protein EDB86DRAFT_3079609 [Lactarius hatsudake]